MLWLWLLQKCNSYHLSRRDLILIMKFDLQFFARRVDLPVYHSRRVTDGPRQRCIVQMRVRGCPFVVGPQTSLHLSEWLSAVPLLFVMATLLRLPDFFGIDNLILKVQQAMPRSFLRLAYMTDRLSLVRPSNLNPHAQPHPFPPLPFLFQPIALQPIPNFLELINLRMVVLPRRC
jgi:hypothetical protein